MLLILSSTVLAMRRVVLDLFPPVGQVLYENQIKLDQKLLEQLSR
jgi:hypothetical protein